MTPQQRTWPRDVLRADDTSSFLAGFMHTLMTDNAALMAVFAYERHYIACSRDSRSNRLRLDLALTSGQQAFRTIWWSSNSCAPDETTLSDVVALADHGLLADEQVIYMHNPSSSDSGRFVLSGASLDRPAEHLRHWHRSQLGLVCTSPLPWEGGFIDRIGNWLAENGAPCQWLIANQATALVASNGGTVAFIRGDTARLVEPGPGQPGSSALPATMRDRLNDWLAQLEPTNCSHAYRWFGFGDDRFYLDDPCASLALASGNDPFIALITRDNGSLRQDLSYRLVRAFDQYLALPPQQTTTDPAPFSLETTTASLVAVRSDQAPQSPRLLLIDDGRRCALLSMPSIETESVSSALNHVAHFLDNGRASQVSLDAVNLVVSSVALGNEDLPIMAYRASNDCRRQSRTSITVNEFGLDDEQWRFQGHSEGNWYRLWLTGRAHNILELLETTNPMRASVASWLTHQLRAGITEADIWFIPRPNIPGGERASGVIYFVASRNGQQTDWLCHRLLLATDEAMIPYSQLLSVLGRFGRVRSSENIAEVLLGSLGNLYNTREDSPTWYYPLTADPRLAIYNASSPSCGRQN